MRQIKFRAWNTKHHYMDDSFFICASDGSAFDTPSCGYDTPNTEIEPVDDLVVMQFTGLTDINGVEIYEGDILSAPFANGEYAKNIKRKFFNVSVKITPGRGASVELPSNVRTGSYRWYPHFSECEVIGNIYQNPELLK